MARKIFLFIFILSQSKEYPVLLQRAVIKSTDEKTIHELNCLFQ